MRIIYISGPLTKGETANMQEILFNLGAAQEAAYQIIKMKACPFLPHLSWHLSEWIKSYHHEAIPYRAWMELCVKMVNVCDAVLVLPGESPGRDTEESYAAHVKKPIFYSLESLKEWL